MTEESEDEIQKEELYEARHSRFLAKEEERRQGLQLLTDKDNRRIITKYGGVTPNKYLAFQAAVQSDMLDAEIDIPEVDWDALEFDCVSMDGKVNWRKMLDLIRKAKAENGGPRMDWSSYRVLEFIEEATMAQDGWRAKQIENMSSVGQPQTARPSWLSALFGRKKK